MNPTGASVAPYVLCVVRARALACNPNAPVGELVLNESVRVLAFALMLAVCPMATAQAHAALRTGSISFLAPTNPPSFDPQIPATEKSPAVDTFTVAYDDVAGTVTATMRLFEPAFWGPKGGGHPSPSRTATRTARTPAPSASSSRP
jgi:hypothetical protein